MGSIELILIYLTDIFSSFKEVINFIGSLSASVITIYLGYLTLRKSVRFIGYTSYNSVWNGSSYGITLFNNSLTAVCVNEILLVFDSNKYLPILSRSFNEPLTIEPRRIIEVKSNPISKYINISHDELSVRGIIIKYATGEYVFCNFRYNGIFQWIRSKLNCYIWINKKQNRYIWLNKKLYSCTWINKIIKDLNEIESIRNTFGDTVVSCAVKYIVDITNESNLSSRIYILRNGTLSQWISNSNSSLGYIDKQYLNSNTQLGEFLETFFESNRNISVSIYNMDDIFRV